MTYGKILYGGWQKAPELLTVRLFQMFSRLGKPEHLQITEQLVSDVSLVCPDLNGLCEALAKTVIENMKEPE